MIKKETRIIAWDDCAFSFGQKNVLVVGAIFRGGSFLDGLLSVTVKKDGLDATERMARAVKGSRHYDQLSLIMLNGITYAGFNIVDIKDLSKKTGLPVIAVQRNRPDIKKFLLAMKRLKDFRKRQMVAKSAGKVFGHRGIFYQKSGMANSEAEEILRLTCIRSNVPEPLRAAHLIASGLSRHTKTGFESRGRA